MSGAEVLDIVIGQIGDLRVPMREKELRDALDIICGNLAALREAMGKTENAADAEKTDAQEDGPGPEKEVTEDV